MKNQASRNDAQIRVLLPATWVAELDSLAAINQSTRLALIRAYLRDNLDRDLINLQSSYVRRNSIQKAAKLAQKIVEDRFNDW